jgi:hypothetical protein
MNRSIGWGKVGLGILCFAVLTYWILALNTSLPGSEFFESWYEQRTARRGPWGVWVLAIGGLLLIGWGLRDLGVSGDS